MGRPLYTNNAATYLAFGITNTATTMQVSANAGSLFPNPTGGDYFYVSLISLSGPIIEIVKCTARSGDIFTIERGQEGTSALYWNMGDNVQLRITAAGMNYIAGSTASTTLEQSFTATQGQTVFTLTNFDYAPGTNNLAVFVNGSKQVSGTNYTETNVNTVTFTTGLNVGDVIEFLSNLSVSAGTIYATDINYNEGATGAVTRTLESKLQESVSVKDFGATGNGITDDTIAIQDAINYMTSVGGQLFFPKGYYKVTSTLNVGLPYFNTYDFIVNRTAPIADATYSSNENASNIASNRSLKKIDLVGEAETYLVANFTPSTYQPVLAYNLDNQTQDSTGRIENLNIISSAVFGSGVYNPSLVSTYAINKLIGIYTGRGATVVSKLLFSDVGVGLLAVSAYWCSFKDLNANLCNQGYNYAGCNATNIENNNIFVCNTGLIFDGQNSKVSGTNTENTNNDLVILAADCCLFELGYLEDTRTTGGTGNYAVTLGNAQNTYNVTECTFISILTLINGSSGKGGWRIWSTVNAVLDTIRLYSSSVTIDTISFGYATGCDATIAAGQFYNNGTLDAVYAPFIGDSFGNNFTYNSRAGAYSRTGNVVTASVNLSWTNLGSAGASNLIVTLPFPARNVTGLIQSATVGYVSGVPTGSHPFMASILPNTTYLTFIQANTSAAPTTVTANSCSTSGEIALSITYLV